jgi:hypothetical protein
VVYKGPIEWPAFVKSLRPGDKAVVAELSVFGSRKALRDALEEIVARQATLSTATPVDIDAPTLREVSATETRWAGQRAMKSGRRARELGKRGNEVYRKKREESRMAKADAEAIWRDRIRYPLRAEAVEAMRGWTVMTAWRAFGPREPETE